MSVPGGMLSPVSAPFGMSLLVIGSETLLAERATRRRVAAARKAEPAADLVEVEAGDLEGNRLAELSGGSLFAPATIAVIHNLPALPAEVTDALVQVAGDPGESLALVMVHPGGNRGKALVDRLKKAGVEREDANSIKPWEVARFVQAEARHHRLRMDADSAQALVDAVGNDLRALVAALSQLQSDADGQPIDAAFVTKYFAGRAEVTGFAVADEVMRRHPEAALEKLRWSLATGVAPVLITSAVASQLRALGRYHDVRSSHLPDQEVARQIEVSPFRVKELARQARTWSPTMVAHGVRRVAVADAQVKGAATDPGYALERLVIDLTVGD